jgi:transcriptional regulator with XRE-family HTH domain
MSQEEVADYLHISQSAYARMESGESTSWVNYILKIAKIYEINPDELLRIDGNREFSSENFLSEKVIEQYEERIKELKKVIKELKKERK